MKRKITKKKTSNRGGVKVEQDGIQFKSKLELYTYRKLKESGLPTNYETITYEILPPIIFPYNDKKTQSLRALKYTPDFVGDNFIIECKGYANESFPLRWKMFKHFLHNNGMKYHLFMPSKQKEVDEVIDKILELQT